MRPAAAAPRPGVVLLVHLIHAFSKGSQMVSCSGRERVAAYVWGALDTGDAERFEAHLAGCSACMAEIEQLTGIRTALSSIDHRAPPPGGLSRLRAAIAAYRRRAPR